MTKKPVKTLGVEVKRPVSLPTEGKTMRECPILQPLCKEGEENNPSRTVWFRLDDYYVMCFLPAPRTPTATRLLNVNPHSLFVHDKNTAVTLRAEVYTNA